MHTFFPGSETLAIALTGPNNSPEFRPLLGSSRDNREKAVQDCDNVRCSNREFEP